MVCHRMCDYHHYSPEEEETDYYGHYHRREGTRRRVPLRHNDQDDGHDHCNAGSTTGEVVGQENNDIVTDRLRDLRSKCLRFFSHGSRAGTTTRGDMTTTRVAAAACNGTDYNNCDVSTTATSTTGSDTESTTSTDTDLQDPTTFTAVDNPVDLINPQLDNCTHYILMLGAAGKAPPPQPPGPVILSQARLPQPTVFDGTTPPFQEWIQETTGRQ